MADDEVQISLPEMYLRNMGSFYCNSWVGYTGVVEIMLNMLMSFVQKIQETNMLRIENVLYIFEFYSTFLVCVHGS